MAHPQSTSQYESLTIAINLRKAANRSFAVYECGTDGGFPYPGLIGVPRLDTSMGPDRPTCRYQQKEML